MTLSSLALIPRKAPAPAVSTTPKQKWHEHSLKEFHTTKFDTRTGYATKPNPLDVSTIFQMIVTSCMFNAHSHSLFVQMLTQDSTQPMKKCHEVFVCLFCLDLQTSSLNVPYRTYVTPRVALSCVLWSYKCYVTVLDFAYTVTRTIVLGTCILDVPSRKQPKSFDPSHRKTIHIHEVEPSSS